MYLFGLEFCLDICPGMGLLNHVCVCLVIGAPPLCNSMDCSLPGSSVCGIFLARILEWVAITYSMLGHMATLLLVF